jgi:choline dehydrogenase-like flavoprotein
MAEEAHDHHVSYVSRNCLFAGCDSDRITTDTAGAASMLPKDKGGVVDPTLKVYGTTNLRVVDLSVVPLHFASHPVGMFLIMFLPETSY